MKNTVEAIRNAVRGGRLNAKFRGADINSLLGITWGGNFLAKHCVGNGYTTEHFVRVSRGLYSLK